MAALKLRIRLRMDCLDGAWESLDDNRRCRFTSTVYFTMRSLVHLNVPYRVFKVAIMWKQPTPFQYAYAMPAVVVEVSSPEEDRKKTRRKRSLSFPCQR